MTNKKSNPPQPPKSSPKQPSRVIDKDHVRANKIPTFLNPPPPPPPKKKD